MLEKKKEYLVHLPGWIFNTFQTRYDIEYFLKIVKTECLISRMSSTLTTIGWNEPDAFSVVANSTSGGLIVCMLFSISSENFSLLQGLMHFSTVEYQEQLWCWLQACFMTTLWSAHLWLSKTTYISIRITRNMDLKKWNDVTKVFQFFE